MSQLIDGDELPGHRHERVKLRHERDEGGVADVTEDGAAGDDGRSASGAARAVGGGGTASKARAADGPAVASNAAKCDAAKSRTKPTEKASNAVSTAAAVAGSGPRAWSCAWARRAELAKECGESE